MSKFAITSALGLGAASAGGFGAYHFYSKSDDKSLRAKLISEKYAPLEAENKDHKTHWTTSLEKYKTKHTDSKQWNESQLKNLCNDLFKKEDIKTDDYNEARKYCVVPRSILERLKDLDFATLDTGEGKETTKWTQLSEGYKKGGTSFKKLNNLENTGITGSNGDTLRGKCDEVLKKDHWDDNYDALLDSSKVWCTEQGFKSLPPQ
ncbi:hypothetical protein HF1_08730 [Mycoplasma haemofelis str. Langford 1]|uniref:Uncharacterized protein n=1 Tax=Mycoplasma haemofelis (strain Langford 1) TaxID=941640 RepID=E8ZIB0_MYCHL|nr:hypothetical protein [Mycoplasma haemofelis]CBY92881.1 hypothetical protein HF1_08730 [Mycoplasma haemofelis str. Langford 1]